jgi:hypothetical protein
VQQPAPLSAAPPSLVSTLPAPARLWLLNYAVPVVYFLFFFIYLLTVIDPSVIYSNNGFNNDLFVRYLHQKESDIANPRVPDTYSGDGFIFELRPGYFRELFSAPDGLTRLTVAACITTCRSRFAGACALTFLAWVLFALFTLYIKRCGGTDPFGIGYVPALLLLYFIHYYNLKPLVWLVPVTAALAAAIGYTYLSQRENLWTTVQQAPFFWLCWYLCGWAGPLLLVFIALVEFSRRRAGLRPVMVAVFLAINGSAVYFLETRVITPEHTLKINALFTWPVPTAYLFAAFPLLTVLLLAGAWKKPPFSLAPVKLGIRTIVLAAGSVAVIVWTGHDPLLRDIRAVSRTVNLVQHHDWNALVKENYAFQFKSFPGKPGPLHTYLTHVRNRALVQTGTIGSEMFSYPQASFSPEPLLLRNSIVGFGFPLWAAAIDLFMELGLVNYAEKTIGELMECMGPYPFLLYRRSLLHLAKQNPETASVYLNRLSVMPGYRSRARQLLGLVSDSTALSQVPAIAHLRACMDTIDYFFLSGDEETLFLNLLKRNPRNKPAFDYLMAYYLQTGRTEKLVARFKQAKDFGYTKLPRHWEEAICVFMTREERDTAAGLPEELPMVSPATFSRFDRFMQRYFALEENPAAAKTLAGDFGSTFYYFYSFETSSGARR